MSMNPVSNPMKSGEEVEEETEEVTHQDSETSDKQTESKEEILSTEELRDKEDSVIVKESPEGRFVGDAQIGNVIEMCPEAKSVIEKYFGACANCPAILKETIVFQALIHKLDLKLILDELNQLCL
ncbi:MAG: hypothetical protein ACFE7E_03120 [Candidatus Hodarchaeota archaeon]